ncbi:ribosomal protein S18-alanine N-acetyltransferase [Natroniella sulfidigena]|uniref:ribosomal protein S18-alanine N-acetyltransferase n=1 Tax=Natroniella sulfidigena TaxID=723921 RepID=UPI002009F183|nr:ribosomal protein S18-alanine N-acetyltransferase [Natroniella sulfidigena]MCK8816134.1 ribosomal protein S18-alanine N-acetyltransferase [Natroniella sulfidigena]
MSQLEIAPMQKKYLGQILKIERETFAVPWSKAAFKRELNTEHGYYIVGLVGEQIIAYLGAWIVSYKAHLTTLAISKNYRRQKIATELLRYLYAKLEARKIKMITLEVRMSNQTAQKLYRKEGFVSIGVREGYYSDNQEDALIMWKKL